MWEKENYWVLQASCGYGMRDIAGNFHVWAQIVVAKLLSFCVLSMSFSRWGWIYCSNFIAIGPLMTKMEKPRLAITPFVGYTVLELMHEF